MPPTEHTAESDAFVSLVVEAGKQATLADAAATRAEIAAREAREAANEAMRKALLVLNEGHEPIDSGVRARAIPPA